jgi:hypothetical protein
MIHVMLPIQYLGKVGDRQIEPQKRLMLAVLQTVIDDCRGSQARQAAGLPPPVDRSAYRDARAYLECTDREWPFTFENLCDALGLDAGAFRRQLTGDGPVTNG